ncbi:MAG: hypothetical protein R6X12_01705 [bacterium]
MSLWTREAPALGYRSFRVSGEGGPANGRLDRGETADIRIVLRNAGSAGGPLAARLSSRSPFLEVLDGVGAFPACAEGDTTVSSGDWFRLRAAPGAPVESPLYCDLMLDAPGYHDTVLVPIIVGDSMNLPDGPDGHGYCIFDHTDSTYRQLPVYDWVELRGVGTELTLGADETVTLPLPGGFGPWRFYGRDHGSLSVCSNGFITAGTSGRVDFVNVLLPYSRAPGNIVAACWDDLDPPTGGAIWFHHDTAGRRVIVEYDSVAYFGVSAREKFQVQVYDRTVPTPSGDNRIEVHYQTANYLASATVGLQNADGSAGLTHWWNDWRPRTAAPIVAGGSLVFETLDPVGVAEPAVRVTARRLAARPALFRGQVTIAGEAAGVLAVFDAGGRVVAFLEPDRPGEWAWNGRDRSGRACPPGLYLFRAGGLTGRAALVR